MIHLSNVDKTKIALVGTIWIDYVRNKSLST